MPFTVLLYSFRKPGTTPTSFKTHYESQHIPLLKSLTGTHFPKSHKRFYIQRADSTDTTTSTTTSTITTTTTIDNNSTSTTSTTTTTTDNNPTTTTTDNNPTTTTTNNPNHNHSHIHIHNHIHNHNHNYPATVLVGTQLDFPYDALAELTFEDATKFQTFMDIVSQDEAKEQIAQDEEMFLDRGRMTAVVVGETVVTEREGDGK